MVRHHPLPEPLSRLVAFRVGDAIDAGTTPERLRSSDLAKPFWGIRTVEDLATSTRDRCVAFLPRMPSDAIFSHKTAALLHGLPLPARDSVELIIDVGRPSDHRPLRSTGVRGHRMRFGSHEWIDLGGLPVATPIRTWVDLSPMLSLRHLVAMGDAILRHESLPGTSGELHTAVRDHPFRRGRSNARTALELLDGRSESPMESILRVLLWEAGFSGFVCNLDIVDARGVFVARGDLVDVRSRLVLEYEGDHHRTEAAQWHRDIERAAQLEDLGWTVVRVTRADIAAPDRLLARVRRLKRP